MRKILIDIFAAMKRELEKSEKREKKEEGGGTFICAAVPYVKRQNET